MILAESPCVSSALGSRLSTKDELLSFAEEQANGAVGGRDMNRVFVLGHCLLKLSPLDGSRPPERQVSLGTGEHSRAGDG